MKRAPILVFNTGSSSIKFALVKEGRKHLSGAVSEIAGEARIKINNAGHALRVRDHKEALPIILTSLIENGVEIEGDGGVSGIAHRIVHGGGEFTRHSRLTRPNIEKLHKLSALAPLHNPPALAIIDALMERYPEARQIGVFDTAFHASQPDFHKFYAIPKSFSEKGIRRYGFHGISYEGVRDAFIAKGAIPARLLAFHLGNGASLCAIREGQSWATSMGYSPLEGLVMGTRSGSIDPNAVLELARQLGVEGAATLLNHESGLKGICGHSDMRLIAEDGGDAAKFARALFLARLAQEAGAMIAAMGGVDAVAFTGGIGENDAGIRAGLAERLGFLGLELDEAANAVHAPEISAPVSRVKACIIAAEEELMIAKLAGKLLD